MYPTDRKYSKEHEWVLREDAGVKIGITQFAQSELGDIVFVELPEAGKTFAQGDVLGTIESVKAVSEIFAPISGTVAAPNAALEDSPETVNSDPHGDGWYCTIEPSDPSEIDALMEAAAYKELIGD
jgi:glycine cleavage system H protein